MGMMETCTASNGRDYETIVEEEFRQGASKRGGAGGGGIKGTRRGPRRRREEERGRRGRWVRLDEFVSCSV